MQLVVMNPSEQHSEAYQCFRSKQSNWVPLSCLKVQLDGCDISLNGGWQAVKSSTRKKGLTATLVKMFAARRRKFVKKTNFFDSLDPFEFDLLKLAQNKFSKKF